MKETNYYDHFMSIGGHSDGGLSFWNEKIRESFIFLEITLRKEFDKKRKIE